MSQFKIKNLPTGFEFPLTQREVRLFVKTSTTNFESIDFANLNEPPKWYTCSSHWVCTVRADFREPEWYFSWSIRGMKSEHYEGRRQEIAAAIICEIEKWIASKLALSVTAPKKSCRAIVRFDLKNMEGRIGELSERDWSI